MQAAVASRLIQFQAMLLEFFFPDEERGALTGARDGLARFVWRRDCSAAMASDAFCQ